MMKKCESSTLLPTLVSLAVLVTTISCISSQSTNLASRATPLSASSPGRPNAACERLTEIKLLPHKSEPVDDPAYNAVIAEGERVIPCLIKKISDRTQIPDPRQAPKVAGTTVGDVAYFILVDLAKLNFEEHLPQAVKKSYRRDGIYGYFEQIDEANNRAQLEQNLTKWYEQKTGMKLK